MLAGRLFHMTGAEYEKERLANSVVSLGTVSSGTTENVLDVWQVGNVLNKMLVEVGGSTSCMNLSKRRKNRASKQIKNLDAGSGIEAFEMWIWRKMEKISWTAKVSNSEVLNRVNENRCIISTINERKRRWLGHVLRHDVLLRDILEGRERYERQKETTADEQHMRGIRNSKETN